MGVMYQNTSVYSITGAAAETDYGIASFPQVTNTGAGGANALSIFGVIGQPSINTTGATAAITAYGVHGSAIRANTNDVSNTGTYIGTNGIAGHAITLPSGSTSANAWGVQGQIQAQAGTITTAQAFRSNLNTIGNTAGATVTITNLSQYDTLCTIGSASGSVTVGTYYGLRLVAPTVNASGSITTRYGVYQADTVGTNYFAANVGIGTSSPYSLLDVYSSITSGTTGEATGVGSIRITNGASALSSAGGLEFKIAGDTSGYGAKIQTINSGGAQLVFANRQGSATWTERMRIDSSGNVGIGTSSPTQKLQVAGSQLLASPGNSVYTYFDGTPTYVGREAAAGSLVFGVNSSERMRIDSSGIVTMSAYGAGAATFSAAGVISSVSDETWKTKDGVPTNTDAMLQKLEPGYWFYNEEKAPTFGEERQLGFYAQNVHDAIGEEAAPTPQEGKPWGYHDRSVLAIAVMSLKNALNTIEELKQRIETLENK
jgi:hypothetical protein